MSIIERRKSVTLRHLVLVAAIMALLPSSLLPRPAVAGAQDYRFELSGAPIKNGETTLVRLRLIHISDGKPVPGAIIIQTKFDMGPDGMASMTAPAKVAQAAEPGVYEIETEPPMGGTWALSLAAKVQGEAETVRGSVNVPVPK